jgi:tRNA modification GTPase
MSIHADTILAPATALGGGVAILRVSGPLAAGIAVQLSGIDALTPRLAELVTLRYPGSGKILDKGLLVYFKGPHSFTGEDIAEFHIHGGRAIADTVMRAILSLDPTIRLAEGGEFSKRAYLNGKIDLTEAEAIADLVAAETDVQAEQALAQMNGALRELYEEWRAQLVRLLSHMEAAIDFVDEEDVPADLLRDTNTKITTLTRALEAHLDDNNIGERLRDGFSVAVIGAPNAGKSSLVNALAKRDVAIVSHIAGTTRDAIEVHLNLGGYPVILVDTAGLRDTDDPVESIGIQRARKRAEHADLVLALFDGTQKRDAEIEKQITDKTIVVTTKADLAPTAEGLAVSATTHKNLDLLVKTLTDAIRALAQRPTGAVLTRARHREAVTETRNHLLRAIENPQPELKAEDMRLAARALGKLTGRVDVEDLLDVIFSEFCIGK